MDQKNIFQLTEEEYKVYSDLTFMPIKQRVCEKLEGILGQLHAQLRQICEQDAGLPRELLKMQGKISRGENYNAYAYRVLDYPRYSKDADMFFYRTLILWGQPTGFHLILTGTYKERVEQQLLAQQHSLPDSLYISQQETPWIWEADDPGLLKLQGQSAEQLREILTGRPFLKLSAFLPVESYAEIPVFGVELWGKLRESLTPT